MAFQGAPAYLAFAWHLATCETTPGLTFFTLQPYWTLFYPLNEWSSSWLKDFHVLSPLPVTTFSIQLYSRLFSHPGDPSPESPNAPAPPPLPPPPPLVSKGLSPGVLALLLHNTQGTCKYLFSPSSLHYPWDWQTVSVKGQRENITGSVAYRPDGLYSNNSI